MVKKKKVKKGNIEKKDYLYKIMKCLGATAPLRNLHRIYQDETAKKLIDDDDRYGLWSVEEIYERLKHSVAKKTIKNQITKKGRTNQITKDKEI